MSIIQQSDKVPRIITGTQMLLLTLYTTPLAKVEYLILTHEIGSLFARKSYCTQGLIINSKNLTMSSNQDQRGSKRPQESSGSSETKPGPKKSRSYDPKEEATALGSRQPPQSKAGPAKASVSSMEGVEEVNIDDEVFNPGNRTTADLSSTDDLFELALETGNFAEALNAADSDEQRRRVWAAQDKVES